MTCQSYRETLLDVARGVAVPTGIAGDAEAHAAACVVCGIELERQRELTSALKDLRDEASGWTLASALEERLLRAVAAEQQRSIPLAPARRSTQFWYAAAAAILIAGVGLGVRSGNREEPPHREAAKVNRDATAPPDRAAAIDEPRRSAEGVRPAEPVARRVRRVRTQVAALGRVDAARTIEFLTIPTAVGLPRMESARIIRTEVPVSALPAYGVAIVPDAARSAVQADLLIGQDGQPRGIRLVSARQEQLPPRSEQ